MAGSIAIIFGILGLIVACVQAAMAIGYGFSKDTPKSQRTSMFAIAAMAGVLFVVVLGLMFMAHSKRKSKAGLLGGLEGDLGELVMA